MPSATTTPTPPANPSPRPTPTTPSHASTAPSLSRRLRTSPSSPLPPTTISSASQTTPSTSPPRARMKWAPPVALQPALPCSSAEHALWAGSHVAAAPVGGQNTSSRYQLIAAAPVHSVRRRSNISPEYRKFVIQKFRNMVSTKKNFPDSVLLSKLEKHPENCEEEIFEASKNELDYLQKVNTLCINLEIGNWKALNEISSNGDKSPCIPNKGCEPKNTNLVQEQILPQHMLHQQPFQYLSQNSDFNQQMCVQRQEWQSAQSTMIPMLPTPTLPSSYQPSPATNHQNVSLLQRQLGTEGNTPLEHVYWQHNNPLLHGLQMEPNFLGEMHKPGSSQQFQNVIAQKNRFLPSQGELPVFPESHVANVPALEVCRAPLNWQEDTNQKVYHNLLQEIQQINRQPNYTTVSIENEDVNQVSNSGVPKNIIIWFSTKTIDPNKKLSCIPEELAKECHLRLLISPGYPNHCPRVLGTIPSEKWCHDASFIFRMKVEAAQKPISVGVMVRLWDSSCHQVIIKIAKQCIT